MKRTKADSVTITNKYPMDLKGSSILTIPNKPPLLGNKESSTEDTYMFTFHNPKGKQWQTTDCREEANDSIQIEEQQKIETIVANK